MVVTHFARKILKTLDEFLLKKNDFKLGESYDLVLLEPTNASPYDGGFSLMVSARKFDNLSERQLISELFKDFIKSLTFDEYNSIARINVLNSELPFVKSMKMVFAFREPIIEVHDYTIAGVTLQHTYVVKSLVLDKLMPYTVVSLGFSNGSSALAGIVRLEKNFDLVYYTQKGVEKYWNLKTSNRTFDLSQDEILHEHQLIEEESLARIPFKEVEWVR